MWLKKKLKYFLLCVKLSKNIFFMSNFNFFVMDLLFFLKSGLWRSARRWKFAFNKNGMLLFCAGVMFFMMFLFTPMTWVWSLPVIIYLIGFFMSLVLPNDEMIVGRGKKQERLLIFALGESHFGMVRDGVFLRTRKWRIVEFEPFDVYKRRFGDVPMMLLEYPNTKACYVYSENYPLGLYLGYAQDEDMVFFADRVFHEIFVIVPGKVCRINDVKSLTAGKMLYSDFWSKAAYYRLDALSDDDKIDEFGFKELCYHLQVDVKHFLMVELEDNWFKLLFVLLSRDNVVEVLEVREVDMVRFHVDDKDERSIDLQYDEQKKLYFLS